MTDRSSRRVLDSIPEADFAEQSVPANPNDETELNEAPEQSVHARDAFDADPADLVEQSIPAPMDDEPDRD
ncbi:hypothetical protein D5S18_09480 [Nocardia panacis]|uniref:Uncharacterized protein n=1 Tax=Nocardia panacis TaxID=2340916 RepID=A0A3A4KCW6_9NOCA|nr:hypothetical protein [Nocardia panacis]RJO76521.1 hypothetical protein D5S18_09480 [Nocardia panacis]